jgi:hypothetical protein
MADMGRGQIAGRAKTDNDLTSLLLFGSSYKLAVNNKTGL